jgi:hypothetical protein
MLPTFMESSMPFVRLKSVHYAERVGRRKEWTLNGLTLVPINLIVGTNSTGKTRALNIIGNLAKQLVSDTKFRPMECGYDMHFEHQGGLLRYLLQVENGKVTREEVYVDGKLLLARGVGGEGEIFAAVECKKVRFKPPENELAVVARRDSLQHPFLEPLHEWARAVRHYTFGTSLGKDRLLLHVKDEPEADERDPNQVIGIFQKAVRALGPSFIEAVRRDMTGMGYNIEHIGLFAPEGVKFVTAGVPAEVLGLGIKERGIDGIIDQNEMSQGMFRALSILIQVNYSQMSSHANCILIDDIGEGLDFDRSTRLIQLLRQKAQDSSMQLIMTTNDRFVMNQVPLEDWSVLQRHGGHVQVLNYQNSRDLFEEFKFTGLSNFSFLETDFANGPRAEEASAHE